RSTLVASTCLGYPESVMFGARREESLMKPVKTMQAMAVVAVVIFGSSFGVADVAAVSQDGEGRPALAARHAVAGSWLVTYDVPAFGEPFPLLLSLGDEGIVIET